jgi:hypothetical protein
LFQGILSWGQHHVSALDITTAVANVDEDMLRSVWTELDYRIDICRVTKGLHIEHL